MTMPLKIKPFNILDHLKTPEQRAGYLEAALAEGDAGTIALVIGDIVRAMGVAKVVKDTGLSRETIYKSFKAGGNPTLSTTLKVAKALDLKLAFQSTAKSKPTKTRAKPIQAAE
jgi:probable addiction module antidote protein